MENKEKYNGLKKDDIYIFNDNKYKILHITIDDEIEPNCEFENGFDRSITCQEYYNKEGFLSTGIRITFKYVDFIKNIRKEKLKNIY